jgi:hypothetical protein
MLDDAGAFAAVRDRACRTLARDCIVTAAQAVVRARLPSVTITTVESCTGGLVPPPQATGSSAVFELALSPIPTPLKSRWCGSILPRWKLRCRQPRLPNKWHAVRDGPRWLISRCPSRGSRVTWWIGLGRRSGLFLAWDAGRRRVTVAMSLAHWDVRKFARAVNHVDVAASMQSIHFSSLSATLNTTE